jgi:hypothetical protein
VVERGTVEEGIAGDLAGEVDEEIVVEAAASAGALRKAALCEEELDSEVVETVAMEALEGHAIVEGNRDWQSSSTSFCSAEVRSMGVALSA